MGFLDKLIPKPIASSLKVPSERSMTSYRTFTEPSPTFGTAWDPGVYQEEQTRAIIERIATACSKLHPEFVSPEGSKDTSSPRVRAMVSSSPNDMQTWPEFLKLVSARLYADTTAYVVPQYDQSGAIVGLFSLKPNYTEVIEYEGEPWLRFHMRTGDTQAFPFYDVAILTRFQLESDIFGGTNRPLEPTLRLMHAQRQAEEVALKTGADIRFIGKLTGMVHEKEMNKKRDRFYRDNISSNNQTGLMVYDQTFEDIKQINQQHYVSDPDTMARIDAALYRYFGINEKILTNSYDEATWAAFYEGTVEVFAIQLATKISMVLFTPTQIRKGNAIMFSSGYLEYSTPDSKRRIVGEMADRGLYTTNEARDVLQLSRIPGGDVRMIRGEYYLVDEDNNIVAESGGHHSGSYSGTSSGGWGNGWSNGGDES